jgi:hypothetical protein
MMFGLLRVLSLVVPTATLFDWKILGYKTPLPGEKGLGSINSLPNFLSCIVLVQAWHLFSLLAVGHLGCTKVREWERDHASTSNSKLNDKQTLKVHIQSRCFDDGGNNSHSNRLKEWVLDTLELIGPTQANWIYRWGRTFSRVLETTTLESFFQ